jgi:hypothetical protein
MNEKLAGSIKNALYAIVGLLVVNVLVIVMLYFKVSQFVSGKF